MNFDKLKNLFTRSVNTPDEETLFERAASIINSSRKTIPENSLSQFQTYLQNLPSEELRTIKNAKPKTSRTASLRPQLVVRCYQQVPQTYFDPTYAIQDEFFTRNHKEVSAKTSKMHQWLDQVEICLFNQISSRFDQILSVLRTIQSLQCVVTYNSNRLRQVRQNNVQIARSASQRHIKIVHLLRRQQHLRKVLEKLSVVKYHQQYTENSADLKLQRSSSHHYQQINDIRMNREFYFQLNATKNFEDKVEQFELNLKKGYSDTINDAFFKYAVELFPYDSGFWEKKFIGRMIFEVEEEAEADGTVILDESMLVEQQIGFKIKVSEQVERDMVQNLVSGWREGEYSTGSIKAAFDKFIKEKHLRFCSDCRNFCFQAHLSQQRKKIDNPSLLNLIQQMNIYFFTKTLTFYADMYRNLLTRVFSLISLMVKGMVSQSSGELNMQQKQKITGVVDGLFSILYFVFKAVYDRIIETLELKQIYSSMQLNDFKQIINILETEEEFISKYLRRFMEIDAKGTFLEEFIANQASKLDFQLVKRAKQQKVLSFLNKTHCYILQNQLRDSFQKQIWIATDIPTFYYDSLHYLITGESLNLRRNKNHTIRHNVSNNFDSSVFVDRMGASNIQENNFIGNFRIIRSQIIIDNQVYKVTQTLLLLLEIIQDYMHLAQFYPFVKNEVGVKIYQLMKAYNTSSHQLIILGGAVKLQKIKTKNITAKHLALNSLCLSFLLYVIQCIRIRVPVFEQNKIKSELLAHQDTTIKKLASILSGKVTQALNDINLVSVPSKGTEAIVNSTKILHDILVDFYQKQILSQIFVRENVLVYLNRLKAIQIVSKMQAESLKDDMNFYFHELQFQENLIQDFKDLRMMGEDIIRMKFQEM